MGNATAQDMAEQVDTGGLSLYEALKYHLTVNHFPPVPEALVPVCVRIVEEQGQWGYDDTITLPEDVRWRGQTTAPIQAVIEEFHLDSFLEQFEVEE